MITPAPWGCDFASTPEDVGDDNIVAVIYNSDYGTIANIPDDLLNYRDNACLIATAPELLGALRSLYYAISDEEDDYPDSQLYHIVMNATKKARVALDKAGTP